MSDKSAPYPRSPEYFAALDGFRGLLALSVAIFHTIWLSNINQLAFFNNGAVIIDLFFVFSGFLMYRLYGSQLGTGKQAKTFLKRRFARIYPIHFFMTMVFLAFGIARILAHKVGIAAYTPGEVLPFQAEAVDGWGSLLSNLTMTHAMGLHDSLTFNPPSWTISVEFFAYFTFAALLLWMPPRKTWHFGVIGIGITAIYGVLSQLKPDMDITYDLGFWRCMAGFYTGVIGCRAYQVIKARMDEKQAPAKTGLWSLVELIMLLAGISFIVYCPGKLQFFCAPVLFMFVLIFAFDKGAISRFMGHKIFGYLAKISYSVYMIHVIISIVFDVFANKALPMAIGETWTEWMGDLYMIPYLIAVIICAHITYHLIEVPGRKWITKIDFSRLLGRRKKPVIS